MVIIGLPSSLATTRLVPSQYNTIQDGIDAAVNGDTVLVAAGTYSGVGNRDIELLGKSIVVMSESGPEVTTIDGEQVSGTGFNISQNETNATVIKGFRIINVGSAIYCSGSDPLIEDCILEFNSTGVSFRQNSSAIVKNSIIRNTTSDHFGAGIYSDFNNMGAIVQNCLISNNTSTTSGGGVLFRLGAGPQFINCTISGNSAQTYGGGIAIAGGDYLLRMKNCIVWGNTAPTSPNLSRTNFEITYSNVEGDCIPGIGNLSVDPQFDDTLYHVASGSPSVDAGHPDDAYHLEPISNGGRINMGAYGNTNQATISILTKPVISLVSPDAGMPSGGEVDSIFGRQFGEVSGQVFYGGAGASISSWSDTLIVCITPNHPAGRVTVQVINAESKKDSLTFGYTYLGPAVLRVPSEYPTIQSAINCATDEDTVLVAAGTYSGTGNRDLDLLGKSIVVISEAGPQMTFLDCDNKRGFTIDSGEDAATVVNGFRIVNASTAVYCEEDITLSNCIMENSGRGVSLDGSSMSIRNCVVRNNNSSFGAGGIFVRNSPNSIISNCLIVDNSTTGSGAAVYVQTGSSPWIINCTLANNSADYSSGGILVLNSSASLRMKNCIVWGNTAGIDPNIRANNYGISYSNIEDSTFTGSGNISENPRFEDVENQDYHLSSISTSIDAGDPGDEYVNEPIPNGGRINMGAYGNTAEATSFQEATTILGFHFTTGCSTTDFTLNGFYFGEVQGGGSVMINNQSQTITNWSDTSVSCTISVDLVGQNDIVLTSDALGSDTIFSSVLYTPKVQYVSGNVSGMWTAACPGIYMLTDDVTIPAGDTLVIEPGVQVLVNIDSAGTEVDFKVYGSLMAMGTKQNPIKFSVLQEATTDRIMEWINTVAQQFH